MEKFRGASIGGAGNGGAVAVLNDLLSAKWTVFWPDQSGPLIPRPFPLGASVPVGVFGGSYYTDNDPGRGTRTVRMFFVFKYQLQSGVFILTELISKNTF
jgi:hypothetical protein